MLNSQQLEKLDAAIQEHLMRIEDEAKVKDDNQKSNLAKRYGFESRLEFYESAVGDAELLLALKKDSIVFHGALEAIYEGFGYETEIAAFPPGVVLKTGRPRDSASPFESFTPILENYRKINRTAITEIVSRLRELRMLQHYLGIAEPDGDPRSTAMRGPDLDVLRAIILEQETARKTKEVEPGQVIVDQAGEIAFSPGQSKEPGDEK